MALQHLSLLMRFNTTGGRKVGRTTSLFNRIRASSGISSRSARLFASHTNHNEKHNVWEIPVTSNSKPNRTKILYTYASQSEQDESRKWTKSIVPVDTSTTDNLKSDQTSLAHPENEGLASYMEKIHQNTVKHLLPNGYPESVHSGYMRYAIYSFIANTASTATMVLSTQTLLLAIGVGQEHAAPISATLNWILKDGIGQFGGILFASKISSSTNSVDADPKRWRMVSSLAMDSAMMLELATTAFPKYFVLIASVANVGKNIAFLTASASRARLHQCLLGENGKNLGDVTGKATSQSIVASLAGTGLGIGLSPFLLGDLYSVGMGCFVLSAVNQIFTYHSLKNVSIDQLNRQRLMILFELYFKGLGSGASEGPNEELIRPERVCEHESFIPILSKDQSHEWLCVGSGVMAIAPNGPADLYRLRQPNENYILDCSLEVNSNGTSGNPATTSVRITFLEDAGDEDILRGVFQAFTIKASMDGQIRFNVENIDGEPCHTQKVVNSSHKYMDRHFSDFKSKLSRAGWSFDDEKSIILESDTDVRIRLDNQA